MSAEKHDLGNNWSFSFFTEQGVDESTGLIIYGPASPECKYKGPHSNGFCGGGIHFTNSLTAIKEGRPMWTVVSKEPLTLTPSIVCGCNGQHGFITNGVYVPC